MGVKIQGTNDVSLFKFPVSLYLLFNYSINETLGASEEVLMWFIRRQGGWN